MRRRRQKQQHQRGQQTQLKRRPPTTAIATANATTTTRMNASELVHTWNDAQDPNHCVLSWFEFMFMNYSLVVSIGIALICVTAFSKWLRWRYRRMLARRRQLRRERGDGAGGPPAPGPRGARGGEVEVGISGVIEHPRLERQLVLRTSGSIFDKGITAFKANSTRALQHITGHSGHIPDMFPDMTGHDRTQIGQSNAPVCPKCPI